MSRIIDKGRARASRLIPDWHCRFSLIILSVPLSEADTRAKLIDPAIHTCGWTEDLICRETTLGAVEIIGGKARRRSGGRTDYTLRVRVSADAQPVAVALLEAKKDTLPPGHGLDQAKAYLRASQHNVQFVFSSNGHLFVEFDRSTVMTTRPRPISEFPSPADLQERYERIMGFSLEEPVAKPLLTRYIGGEGQRRYFQDAAIRAVFEKVARSATQGTSSSGSPTPGSSNARSSCATATNCGRKA
jgi:type I restriction enzyme, R subunit